MPILLWIFCGFTGLGTITFILSICFPGKIHTHPEGMKQPESVTDLMEDHYYASWKEHQFGKN